MRAIQTPRSFWLTFLLFLSVLHLVHSQDASTVTTIDDRNPAIQYNGVWAPISDSGKSHDGTVMLSRAAGGTATYKFNGIRVSVFGTQGTPGGNTTISTYSIDNGSPSRYTVPTGLTQYQFGVEFYSSPLLSEGEHTLIVTNLNDQAWYWLDYLEVTSPGKTSDPTLTPTPNPIPSSTAGNTQQTPSPTTTPTAGNTKQTPTPTTASTTAPTTAPTADNIQQTPTTTPTPVPTTTSGNTQQQQQSTAGLSKGAIAGIALGVSALIVLLLLAALLWKRRHLKSTKVDSTPDIPKPLERPVMRGNAHLEPYQVEHFVSNITPRNGLNEKRTYNDVAPIRSTENNVNASHSLVNGHASSDSATTQYTSAGREETSDSMQSRPMFFSKSDPPYRGAPSSRSTGNPSSASVPQTPPSVATPLSPSQIPSSSRRSTDGGVRIAGGPPGTREEELEEINDGATLPPAYGMY